MYKKVSVAITMTLAMAALMTVPWSALQRSQAQTNENLESAILPLHNSERAAVGVPPLSWSASLATDAQSCANDLASRGYGPNDILPHCSTGENLAWGTAGAFSAGALAQTWANEKSNWQARGNHPLERADFQNGKPMIGHYTQMVWKNTRDIGCAMGHSDRISVLVCRYSPGGNYLGQTPY